MIPTSAPRNGRTKRFHAIMASDDTNSAAPTPATTFPVASAVASITEITTMYAATGTPSSRRPRSAPRMRPATGATARWLCPQAGDITEVGDEEGGQSRHEHVGGEHEQDVTGQRAHQRGHEP